ncbi:LPXTG cell wall anchor domain-containing protein [Romboutsia sedimentorum]|uniref:LPXTG cell wall anchor domain-containing protein n=1 Tax=Romboutsia sedimentorum TaxID=1368474 RepID=A0ABT7EBN1_9FIRM|nr:NEAT domain-containing protein [Romboutsia sedimentorum]MDK2564344.1 LPXTG cell wall anchor domain-containing protein [Romboutsia sedimentorum]
MSFKKMRNKCLAMSLTVVLLGGNILLVNANESINSNKDAIEVKNINQESKVKISEIKNNIIMEDESKEEKALNREFLNEVSYIEEKDGKLNLNLNFNSKIDEKDNLQIFINDKEVKYETILNELDKEKTSIKFEISTVKDKVTVKRNIDETNVPTKFDVDLLEETIKEENINTLPNNQKEEQIIKPAKQNNENQVEKPNENQLEAKNSTTQNGKLSEVENIIISNDALVESMARESLGKISYIEEIDGKTYAQLEFVNSLTKDKEMNILVNGNPVSYNTLSKDVDNGKMIIKYEIPNIDAKTTIKCSVDTFAGDVKQIEYDVMFKKDTLKFIKDITSISTNNVDNSLNKSIRVPRSNATIQTPSSDGKVSSIKNKVSSSNKEFENIGNVQLNETTYIEEINDKTYAIFDFIEGVDSNSNMRITVNDKPVSHEVLSTHFAKGKMRIKFEIPNLDADIEVKNYLDFKKSDINYDVELLENTLKEEQESSTTEKSNTTSPSITKPKLPQTGIGIDGGMITVLGTSMIGAGLVLTKKKDE